MSNKIQLYTVYFICKLLYMLRVVSVGHLLTQNCNARSHEHKTFFRLHQYTQTYPYLKMNGDGGDDEINFTE